MSPGWPDAYAETSIVIRRAYFEVEGHLVKS